MKNKNLQNKEHRNATKRNNNTEEGNFLNFEFILFRIHFKFYSRIDRTDEILQWRKVTNI